jgi:hypothetical protein
MIDAEKEGSSRVVAFSGPSHGSRGQERVKKCRFAISTESAFKNLSFGTRINDVCDVGIHFGSPGKFLGSIFSHVPDQMFSSYRVLHRAFLLPPSRIVYRHFPFSPIALKHRKRQRGCALRLGSLLLRYSRLNRFWFLLLRGHPPRKQTLALGSCITLTPSAWFALRDSGHKKEKVDVCIC